MFVRKTLLLFFLLTLFLPKDVFSHGDLHERIVKVSEQIKVHPDSAYLYFKRGKLYFQHEVYKKSIKDLKHSEKLGYYSSEQQFILARNNFRLKKHKKALNLINDLLESDKLNVRYFKFKGQVLFADKHYQDAAFNFEKVIQHSNNTFPENYLDASLAWQYSNNSNGLDNSKNILKNGLSTLGPLTVFYDKLIDIAVSEKVYSDAINYQKLIVDISYRKEVAYYKLYKLYKLNEDYEMAEENLVYARQHLEKLPERIKNTSFVKSLKNDIEREEKIILTNKS